MSTDAEIWISIATTKRPHSLAMLAADLVEQADEIGSRLRLFVIDNGETAAARSATWSALAGFSSERRSCQINDATTPGGSIARSRRDQREQIRRSLLDARPAFVWMLDDDLRLDHVVVENGRLVTRRLHNHLSFLLDFKRQHSELAVLLGEVNGDPPIPPIATYASRLEDLLATLRIAAALPPHAPWVFDVDVAMLEGLDTVYYDFARGASSVGCRTWIPRNGSCVAAVLAEMLVDACDIPFGIGFSRPILASPVAFERTRDDSVRGAHAVFFTADSFLAQRYPSLSIYGCETRRSDTLASSLFAASTPGRIRRSGFSVRHVRACDEQELPTADELIGSLLSDTWGAALTRALAMQAPMVSHFLAARADQIEAVLARVRGAITNIRGFVLPSWASSDSTVWKRLDGRLGWMQDVLHRVQSLSPRWRDILTEPIHEHALVDFTRRLHEDQLAE